MLDKMNFPIRFTKFYQWRENQVVLRAIQRLKQVVGDVIVERCRDEDRSNEAKTRPIVRVLHPVSLGADECVLEERRRTSSAALSPGVLRAMQNG